MKLLETCRLGINMITASCSQQGAVLIFGLLCYSLTACSQNDSLFVHELDQYLSSLLSKNEPGGAVQITKSNEIIFAKGYGVADIETKELITPNTIFNLGSISKTFVANGILILHEEEKIQLSDGINKYFETFKVPEIIKEITLEHLLAHCSGLPDIRQVDKNPKFFLTADDEENFAPLLEVEALNFKPGQKFEYSNPAYNGLALIIEKTTGKKWQSFIRDRILIPSNMLQSTITDGAHPRQGVAHGYIMKNGKFTEYDYGEYPTFTAAGNGGVWSSVAELAHYEVALKSEIFLKKSTVYKSRQPFHPFNWRDPQKPFVGYSWFTGQKNLFGNDFFDTDFIYHTGSQGGFRAYYVLIPEHDILLTATFNRPVNRVLILNLVRVLQKYNWLK